MLSIPPTGQAPAAVDSPLARWQDQYHAQARIAADGDDFVRQQRLRGFGTWSVVLIDTILLVVAQIVLTIPVVLAAIGIYLLTGHHLSGHTNDTTALQDWLSTPQALAADALATQLGIVLILHFRVIGRGLLSWTDLGFGPALRRDPARAIGMGVALGIAALVVSAGVLALLKGIGLDVSGQEQSLKSVKHASLIAFIPFALTAALTAPLAEEAFFRAYAFRALSVRYGLPIGMTVSALLFGLLHLTGGVGWGAVDLMVIGAILAWGYARTGNLLTNVTAHVLNNVIGLIFLYHG